MAVNKVTYAGQTLVDLTVDTLANANQVASGVKCTLRDGTKATGTLSFVAVRTGSTTPASTLGNDGDIYIKLV